MSKLLGYFSLKYDNDYMKIYNASQNKEEVDKDLDLNLINELYININFNRYSLSWLSQKNS